MYQLESLEHVHVPIEEQINLSGTAAGNGLHTLQPRDAVYSLFHRTGNGDHHLVNWHHPVINADDDAGEICFRENGDRNGQR